jgi:hypothetical protein
MRDLAFGDAGEIRLLRLQLGRRDGGAPRFLQLRSGRCPRQVSVAISRRSRALELCASLSETAFGKI